MAESFQSLHSYRYCIQGNGHVLNNLLAVYFQNPELQKVFVQAPQDKAVGDTPEVGMAVDTVVVGTPVVDKVVVDTAVEGTRVVAEIVVVDKQVAVVGIEVDTADTAVVVVDIEEAVADIAEEVVAVYSPVGVTTNRYCCSSVIPLFASA